MTTAVVVRRRTWALLVVMVLLPTVLLVVRWSDPALGQLPGGWQMHTSCWGKTEEPLCR